MKNVPVVVVMILIFLAWTNWNVELESLVEIELIADTSFHGSVRAAAVEFLEDPGGFWKSPEENEKKIVLSTMDQCLRIVGAR